MKNSHCIAGGGVVGWQVRACVLDGEGLVWLVPNWVYSSGRKVRGHYWARKAGYRCYESSRE